ncbi:MAG: histidine-type phosphatase, partial [Sphingomonas sp.]
MLALLACPLPAAAREAQAPPLTVDRVVVLMRHGVRPPTKDPAMPAGIATDPWPSWPVAPGWLTPHGAEAVARLAVADGVRFRALDLLPPTGCPAPSYVSVYADSDQRTIATAEAWIGALAPGCGIVAAH